jgi:hypothetical protein
MKRRATRILVALIVILLPVVILVPLSKAQVTKISTGALLLPKKLLSLPPSLRHAMLRSSVVPQVKPPAPNSDVITGTSYHNDISPPLRDMEPLPVEARPESEANENPKIPHVHKDSPDESPVQNQPVSAPNMPATTLNFDGIPFPGVACNCAPPDTNGAVGLTQYVQIVNEGFQVFDKTTGASVFGPVGIATLWSGFGGVCQTNGDGDPVVLYDKLANRWVVTQFAGSGVPTDECIAVSTTSDAAGSYNRYGFHLGTNFFDYPKLATWPDAYYMAMNVFNSSGTAFLGPQPFAFNRAAMLAGSPATFVTTAILNPLTDETFLPSDFDGTTLPPANAPNSFVGWPGGVNANNYKIYHFHVDFGVPVNSTFTLFATLPAAGFTELCPTTRACVPEPNGDHLDAIGDRFMFRLAYRNFGDHEAVVTNYTVSSGGVAGIRWIELRNVTTGPVTVFQESTYQPDTTWRWMGSAAQDHNGNMALGFSVSSASVVPGLRYAGRLVTDPLNTLAQGEATLFAGVGSQTGTVNRWGDYSDMTVDPVDDCTFWYTNEYYPAGSTQFNWRTRIGNFKFPGCSIGTPTPTVTGTPPTNTPTNTPTSTPTSTPTRTPTNTPTSTPTLTNTPTPAQRSLTALSPAKVWVSSDTGVKLDLKVEVLINGTPVGTGELDNVNSPTGAFKSNMLNTINLALTNGPASLPANAQLQLRASARRTCSAGGQVLSGTARLWYNGRPIDSGSRADAGSRFGATIGGSSTYYLRNGLLLSTTAGSSRTFIDEALDSLTPCPGRPFTAFGTWSITVP